MFIASEPPHLRLGSEVVANLGRKREVGMLGYDAVRVVGGKCASSILALVGKCGILSTMSLISMYILEDA